jgi:hypothetical protein
MEAAPEQLGGYNNASAAALYLSTYTWHVKARLE